MPMRKTGRRSKKSTIAASPRVQEDDKSESPIAILNCKETIPEVSAELKEEDSCSSPKTTRPTSIEDDSLDLNSLHEQVTNLKTKVDRQYNMSMHKARNTDSIDRDEDPIRLLKAQKVQLLCKMKMDSVHFRLTKAALEKENLHLKKEQRKDKFEMRKLAALNQRQKLVLQRKTEEASLAFKRLNAVLQSSTQTENGSAKNIESELKHSLKVEEIRSEYERQMEEMQEELLKYEEEAEMLKEENFSLMLQIKQMESISDACELKELKKQVGEITDMVGMITQQNSEKSNPKVEQKISSKKCCKCSKKSLCKTSKCECRAADGVCGPDCGCSSSKCCNRETQKNECEVQKNECEIRAPLSEIGNSKGQVSAKKPKRNSRK